MAYGEAREIRSLAGAFTEVTYGVDPGLAAGIATHSFLTYESADSWKPIVDFDATQPHSPSRTNRLSTPGAQRMQRTLKFWLQGGTAAGVADMSSPLIQSCAVTETIVAATSVSYGPAIIGADKSATLGVEHDGWVYLTTGLVGNFVMTATPQKPVTIEYTGRGLYAAPTNTTYATWAGGAKRAKPFINASMIATASSGGHAITFVGNSFTFDRGANIQEVLDFNSATGIQKVIVDKCTPTVTVTFAVNRTPTGSELSVLDFFNQMVGGSITHSIAFTLTGSVGNVLNFAFAQAQIIDLTSSVISGVKHMVVKYNIQSSTDGAEFVWTFT